MGAGRNKFPPRSLLLIKLRVKREGWREKKERETVICIYKDASWTGEWEAKGEETDGRASSRVEWRHPVSNEAETRQNTQISRTSLHDPRPNVCHSRGTWLGQPCPRVCPLSADRDKCLKREAFLSININFFGKITRLIRKASFIRPLESHKCLRELSFLLFSHVSST